MKLKGTLKILIVQHLARPTLSRSHHSEAMQTYTYIYLD